MAEQVHAALVASGAMTRTDVRDLFSRNRSSAEIDDALAALQRTGRAHAVRVVTGGRPAQLWHASAPSRGQDRSAPPADASGTTSGATGAS